MTLLERAGKRTLDISGALFGLIVLSPLFLVIAVLIKRSGPGPVFFRQERLGLGGMTFRMVKFRTMRIDAETFLRTNSALWDAYVTNGFKLPEGSDPRITHIGQWLRKSSLDELPQLWNVLMGEMSLVGPRPLIRDEVDTWYGDRSGVLLSVRPGMTGLWQVTGRSELNYPERADLEIHYVRSRSLLGDLRILLQTFRVVVTREGAH